MDTRFISDLNVRLFVLPILMISPLYKLYVRQNGLCTLSLDETFSFFELPQKLYNMYSMLVYVGVYMLIPKCIFCCQSWIVL